MHEAHCQAFLVLLQQSDRGKHPVASFYPRSKLCMNPSVQHLHSGANQHRHGPVRDTVFSVQSIALNDHLSIIRGS